VKLQTSARNPIARFGKKRHVLGRGSLYDCTHIVFRRSIGSQLRGNTNDKADQSEFKQVSLRQAQGEKQRLTDPKVEESTADQREPSQIVGYPSNQLQTSKVIHGIPPYQVKEAVKILAPTARRRILLRFSGAGGRKLEAGCGVQVLDSGIARPACRNQAITEVQELEERLPPPLMPLM